MYLFACVVSCYVAAKELKTVKLQGVSDRITMLHYVGLEVNARHAHVAVQNVCEVMINRKGKVAFSATKIANTECTRFGKRRDAIAQKLQKAVDLSEFRLLFVVDSATLIADA